MRGSRYDQAHRQGHDSGQQRPPSSVWFRFDSSVTKNHLGGFEAGQVGGLRLSQVTRGNRKRARPRLVFPDKSLYTLLQVISDVRETYCPTP